MKIKYIISKCRNFIISILKLIISGILAFSSSFCFSQSTGVAINTTGASADLSAILDVSSTAAGILIPRMTEAQKNAVVSPALGLMIYQTDGAAGFWYYNGSVWGQAVGPTGATGAQGIQGVTGPTGLLPAGSVAGNTPYWDGSQWVVNSSNIYNNGGSVGIGTNAPDASAAIDVYSINKGVLIPRITNTQRNAISNPADGLQIYNVTTNCLEFYDYNSWQKIKCAFDCGNINVTFKYKGSYVTYGTVLGYNSMCWLGRNLGAASVATAYNDINGYGDLFQWGRLDDGHQSTASGSTTTLSTTDVPGHAMFIRASIAPNDWRSGQNNNLWQGGNSTNNPCPSGWRIPTNVEFSDEIQSWSQNNYYGAFNSPLKLTVAGLRNNNNALIYDAGSYGSYWSSTVSGTYAFRMYVAGSYVNAYSGVDRALGLSVRCIKDY